MTTTDRHLRGAPASQGGQYRAKNRTDAEDNLLTPDAAELRAAGGPKTTPKRLRSLSYSKSESVRAAVASNPRTPASDLERMLNRGETVRRAALGNPSLPATAIQRALQRADEADMDALRQNPAAQALLGQAVTPNAAADERIHSRTLADRIAVASDPKTSPTALVKIAGNQPMARGAALANPSYPAADAMRIAATSSSSDHLNLYRNRTLGHRIIDQMVRSSTASHASAAQHPNTSPRTLARLAQSEAPLVLELVARHPNSAPATVDQAMAQRVAVIETAGHDDDIRAGAQELRRWVMKRERAARDTAWAAARS